jgi:hypothetical protein
MMSYGILYVEDNPLNEGTFFAERILSHSGWSQAKIAEWQGHMRVHGHGILMILAWGPFLPAAAAASLLLRHRNKHPSYPSIRIHYTLAGTGTILNIAGWIVALRNLHVLEHGPKPNEQKVIPYLYIQRACHLGNDCDVWRLFQHHAVRRHVQAKA